MVESVPLVPTLGGEQLSFFLIQLGTLLASAVLLGRVAARFGLAPLVGELLAGVLLAPLLYLPPEVAHWLLPGSTEQWHMLNGVGQIGVLLLVGITGMQLDLGLVRRRGTTAFAISLPGLIIPFGLGLGAAMLLPASVLNPGSDRLTFAVFLGVAMCVSAIPVIAKTLIDLNLLHRNVGQLILVAGTVDDLVGWLGLSIVTAMATTGVHSAGVALSVLKLVAVIAVAVLLGRPLVRGLLRATLRSTEAGPTVAVAVIVVVLCGAATNQLGLEAVFGALVGGMLIRTAGPEVRARLQPLRRFTLAVLAPVFFAIAGLHMDLSALGQPAVLLTGVALLLLAIAGKFSGAFLGARLTRLNRWEALALGAGMNARGVVEIVVAMVGVRLGVLTPAMYTIVVLIAVITSVLASPILRLAMTRVETTADEKLREREESLAAAPTA
jgi:Kef-type K+ transport system membrane component KefB